MKNRINIDFNEAEQSAVIFKALSLPIRLRILKLLVEKPGLNVSELAERLSLPFSTMALHVRILENAGLIFTEEKPGLRGAQKICAILAEDLYFHISNLEKGKKTTRDVSFSMPLGCYFNCRVSKPCGLAGKRSFIGTEDAENAFYSPNRMHTQILWFASGFLEYRFPNHFLKTEKLLELDFSFEACAEAPGYNNDWPSDITIWINDQDVFTFRAAGDYGGRRGIYNPSWWPDSSTQYGELHRLAIRQDGCFGDDRKTSDCTTDILKVKEGDFISFKIGIKEDAEYIGGVNLFGECFGNFKQDIEMIAKLAR
jgi:predicted transcriptional regulator